MHAPLRRSRVAVSKPGCNTTARVVEDGEIWERLGYIELNIVRSWDIDAAGGSDSLQPKYGRENRG
jgi:hypothetical protein